MNKYTPGPWIHIEDDEHYHSVAAGCGYHVNSGDDGFEISGCISKANAMLIAAAPDLLEALSEIINDGGKFVMTHELHRKARAAIAKARGAE